MSKTPVARVDFWRQLVAKQQQSGISVRTFCQQHGSSEYSFYYWRKRRRVVTFLHRFCRVRRVAEHHIRQAAAIRVNASRVTA
jgi:hypothetical protein